MANTTNFGWETPDDTDLVKDGAASIRTLGSAIDTSLVDLKGGTTGQVLSKASNTDLDFTWVAQDDSNAIQNAIVDAKGDLITATAADTPARLAVGTNGQYLIADSTTATGLKWGDVSAGSFTELASGNLSGNNTISLTSISQSYQDLCLRIYAPQNANSRSLIYRVNSDSGGIYTWSSTYDNNWTGFQQGSQQSQLGEIGNCAATNTTTRFHQMYFLGYTSSTHKLGIMNFIRNQYGGFGSFRIETTSAITSVQIILSDSENFSGGTYKLFGVK